MNVEYLPQRQQSDLYLPAFKRILLKNAMHFIDIEVSSEELDMTESTDMIVNIKGGQVALRVREPNILYRDLTIRSRSYYNQRTEIDKLKGGYCDFYLYGWGDGEGNIIEYIFIDLERVRTFKLFDLNLYGYQRNQRMNKDGRTGFIFIELWELQMIDAYIDKNLTTETYNRFIEQGTRDYLNHSFKQRVGE